MLLAASAAAFPDHQPPTAPAMAPIAVPTGPASDPTAAPVAAPATPPTPPPIVSFFAKSLFRSAISPTSIADSNRCSILCRESLRHTSHGAGAPRLLRDPV